MTGALLDRETVGRALSIAGAGPMLVALSGGGDSAALLHLLCEQVGAQRLVAVSVDHGLREAAAEEAQTAVKQARALGVAAQSVRLDWPDGRICTQETARERRYAALCDAARRAGAAVILVGHQRDDQAETVMLRANAKSGWRGLAGMRAISAVPVWPEGRGLWLARPLLGARRAALRAYLRARGAAWIEDPSNTDARFLRVRARTRLARLERQGLDPMRFARLAERLAPMAEKLDREAAGLIEAGARFEAGRVRLSLGQGGGEARRRALAALIAAAAGAAREPAPRAVERIELALADGGFRGATLGGARLSPERGGVAISRDRGALLGRAGVAAKASVGLAAGVETVWDGRLALTAAEPGWRAARGAGPDEPVLEGPGGAISLAEAAHCGAVAGRWLLEERARQLLGVHAALRAPMT